MKNKGIKKMIIKIICILIMLCIIGVLFVTGINLYMKFSVQDNILSVNDCKDLDADCILVLGAGVNANGKPSWMLEDRILTSEELYNVNAAPKIIMSGDHGRNNYDEVNTMKNYVIEDGVDSKDIFMDHAGFSTYESMYRAKEIFGAKKIIIVTQKYHLYRAMYVAKKLGIEAYGVSADKRDYSKMQYYRVAREWIARVKDFFVVMQKPNPTYLGETIDLSGSGDVTNDSVNANQTPKLDK